MRLPSRTPAGMFTRRRLTVRTAPEPLQVGHGSSITVPAPPQSEHGWEIENIPWPWVSMPRPSQRGHTDRRRPRLGAGPAAGLAGGLHRHLQRDLRAGDRLVEGDRDLRLEVGAAFGARPAARPRRPPPAPPNRLERMSPIEEASKSKLPKPPKPPPGPAPVAKGPLPLSYCLRFSGSPSTSWAWEISLKRASASLSSGLRSGWYLRASLR